MFAATYFAPRYFAPRYWPPTGDAPIVPPTGGNRGGRAAGGPGREVRRPHIEKLAERALERAREEGRLRKLADVLRDQGGDAVEWLEDNVDEVQLALINRVERDLEERYGDMPARAFDVENVKVSAAFVADKMTSEAIELAASTIKDLADEIEAKRAEIEADDEDVIAVLLLGL